MDVIERYKIEYSIRDVISILDSSPIQPDLIADTTLVQLTNRIPIVHLAIERGLKALITDAGGNTDSGHALNRLYRDLSDWDMGSADYLSGAFDDAVQFFRINVNVGGFRHLRTLEDYLSWTGTHNAFQALRYWAIGETGRGESSIPSISPSIHRELLCAVGQLLRPNGNPETVSERVEREVTEEMFQRRMIYYTSDDPDKKESVDWYRNWLLREHDTRSRALEEAVNRNFVVRADDVFVRQTLQDAYNELQKSEDPAVLYYIRTLTYLPARSQTRNPDAAPEVEWFNDRQTSGVVTTPVGTPLGFIDKYVDGGWGIEPAEEGAVRVVEIARSLADAKNYLVNRLTRPSVVTVNGEAKRLRIFNRIRFRSEAEWTSVTNGSGMTYEVEFWDNSHGLRHGDRISMRRHLDGVGGATSILDGSVTEISEQKVSIAGIEVFDLGQTEEV